MRKREGEVAQCRRKANFASSLPVFTSSLGIRNCSPWRQGAEATAGQPMASQAPELKETWGGGGAQDCTNAPELKPPEDSLRDSSVPRQLLLNPKVVFRMVPRLSSRQGLPSVQTLKSTAGAQQSPEGQIAQEVMARKQVLFKAFSLCHK